MVNKICKRICDSIYYWHNDLKLVDIIYFDDDQNIYMEYNVHGMGIDDPYYLDDIEFYRQEVSEPIFKSLAYHLGGVDFKVKPTFNKLSDLSTFIFSTDNETYDCELIIDSANFLYMVNKIDNPISCLKFDELYNMNVIDTRLPLFMIDNIINGMKECKFKQVTVKEVDKKERW